MEKIIENIIESAEYTQEKKVELIKNEIDIFNKEEEIAAEFNNICRKRGLSFWGGKLFDESNYDNKIKSNKLIDQTSNYIIDCMYKYDKEINNSKREFRAYFIPNIDLKLSTNIRFAFKNFDEESNHIFNCCIFEVCDKKIRIKIEEKFVESYIDYNIYNNRNDRNKKLLQDAEYLCKRIKQYYQ